MPQSKAVVKGKAKLAALVGQVVRQLPPRQIVLEDKNVEVELVVVEFTAVKFWKIAGALRVMVPPERPISMEVAVVEPMLSTPADMVSRIALGWKRRFPAVRVVLAPSSEKRALPIAVEPVNLARKLVMPEPVIPVGGGGGGIVAGASVP
jgi:hypothetical protein